MNATILLTLLLVEHRHLYCEHKHWLSICVADDVAITELCKVATGAECANYVNCNKKGPLVSAYNRKEGRRLYDQAVAAGATPDASNVYIYCLVHENAVIRLHLVQPGYCCRSNT